MNVIKLKRMVAQLTVIGAISVLGGYALAQTDSATTTTHPTGSGTLDTTSATTDQQNMDTTNTTDAKTKVRNDRKEGAAARREVRVCSIVTRLSR